MRLQTKIGLFILPLFLLASATLGYWSVNVSSAELHSLTMKVLADKIHNYVRYISTDLHGLLVKNKLDSVSSFVYQYQAKAFSLTEQGFFQFFNNDSVLILNTASELIYSNRPEAFSKRTWEPVVQRILQLKGSSLQGAVKTETQKTLLYAGEYFEPWRWIVINAVPEREVNLARNKIRKITLGVSILCVVVGSILIFLVFRRIVDLPVQSLNEAATRIANQDEVDVISVHSADELGDLARNMEHMSKAISHFQNEQKIWQILLEEKVHTRTKELQESELKFRTISDFTYAWEYWINPEGRFIYVSPASERISGYFPEEFMRNMGLLQAIVHPDDYELFASHQGEAVRKGVGEIEFRIVTKAGENRWIAHLCQSVYSDDGTYLGKRASNYDITHKKKAEEERNKLIEELQKALKKVKTLSDILPICSCCKKVRDDEGYWQQVDSYIQTHSEVEISHSMCPQCMREKYPKEYKAIYSKNG